MNDELKKIFTDWYTPQQTNNKVDGASSELGTRNLREHIINLFSSYNIKSIFDAGCNDCNWARLLTSEIQYQGGDISYEMIKGVMHEYPDLNVIHHDVTSDPLPDVDLLLVRDVAIHLNNRDRRALFQNWLGSKIPWILITHCRDQGPNTDIFYQDGIFPFSHVNWELAPWNFPRPTDAVDEYGPNGRCMALWHRDQFKGIL